MQTASKGIKHDTGKLRWDLIPWKPLEYVVRVVTFGAAKYGPANWQSLADARNRYFAALQRHLAAYRMGELFDPETGLPHLAHAACNCLFLMWYDLVRRP